MHTTTITRGVGHSTLESDTRINDVPMVAATCPACDGHNVSDATGRGACGDCGLTDNLSAFMGGAMTASASIAPSKFGRSGAKLGDARKVRAFTISGRVD